MVYGFGWLVPYLDFGTIRAVIERATTGDFRGLSTPEFAYALAAALLSIALALAIAFFLLHAVMIPLAVRWARKQVERSKDRAAFAAQYEVVHQRLERHPIIGHAWKEFDETLVKRDTEPDILRNTVRPQTFINIGVAREQFFGLKMMGSLPSYFVGIGLLLTFIGLVLALSKAGTAAGSDDTDAMRNATRELLHVATFKFSTSIAGLGASILLSMLFRIYTILLEGSFDKLCQSVERRLLYTPAQSVTFEMNEALAGQLSELKQINSAEFFARMGDKISPQIHAAFSSAFAPVTASINQALSRFGDSSQSGIAELISRFTESMQGGAGAELRELAVMVRTVHDALVVAQQSIHGTGEDFGRRMTDAADNLSRLVTEAGVKLREGSEISRVALAQTVTAMRETLDQANRKIDEDLGRAAAGASARIEETMGGTMAKLGQEVERLTAALAATETALAGQAEAIHQAADNSRRSAGAFLETAQQVRAASAPLLQSGERIAGATEQMTATIDRSVAALEAGSAAAKALAQALTGHFEKLGAVWSGYAAQFERVDEDLARSVSALADATQRQGQMLTDYAVQVDHGFASAISRLNPLLDGIRENAEEFGDAVNNLRQSLVAQPAE